MAPILGALLVFVLRVTDVSIGTLRVLYTVRGRRLLAAGLGAVEAGVFIVAIGRVLSDLSEPLKMVGYALGFAAGTALGVTVESWIASGFILARVISRRKSAEVLEALRQGQFGVTAVRGQGREGDVLILFVVARRKRGRQMLGLIQQIDRQAFVTIDSIATSLGGYLPYVPTPTSVRK
jgi:uncharacterized protein YebE (UPF0316 family)